HEEVVLVLARHGERHAEGVEQLPPRSSRLEAEEALLRGPREARPGEIADLVGVLLPHQSIPTSARTAAVPSAMAARSTVLSPPAAERSCPAATPGTPPNGPRGASASPFQVGTRSAGSHAMSSQSVRRRISASRAAISRSRRTRVTRSGYFSANAKPSAFTTDHFRQ